jgi:hypothetical protein
MICVACQTDNKETNKTCRKCGVDLQTAPLWKPSWAWHAKVLAGIYLVLIGVYFALSHFLGSLPQPYRLREIPKEITPWMQKG